jgi:hypothetical protein
MGLFNWESKMENIRRDTVVRLTVGDLLPGVEFFVVRNNQCSVIVNPTGKLIGPARAFLKPGQRIVMNKETSDLWVANPSEPCYILRSEPNHVEGSQLEFDFDTTPLETVSSDQGRIKVMEEQIKRKYQARDRAIASINRMFDELDSI